MKNLEIKKYMCVLEHPFDPNEKTVTGYKIAFESIEKGIPVFCSITTMHPYFAGEDVVKTYMGEFKDRLEMKKLPTLYPEYKHNYLGYTSVIMSPKDAWDFYINAKRYRGTFKILKMTLSKNLFSSYFVWDQTIYCSSGQHIDSIEDVTENFLSTQLFNENDD